jgi:hypothetical protein
MSSNSKIDANRRNSQLSTGPRSDAGKSVVARNACKHNLTSLNIAIAGEDLDEFHILLHETAIDVAPRSTIENALVQQIAYAEWKLLRIARWETEIISAAMSRREAYCQKLFGETPAEALTRLHRYEAQIRRAWHTALREIRIQQELAPPAPQPFVDPATMLETKESLPEPEIDETNPNTPGSPSSAPPAGAR